MANKTCGECRYLGNAKKLVCAKSDKFAFIRTIVRLAVTLSRKSSPTAMLSGR